MCAIHVSRPLRDEAGHAGRGFSAENERDPAYLQRPAAPPDHDHLLSTGVVKNNDSNNTITVRLSTAPVCKKVVGLRTSCQWKLEEEIPLLATIITGNAKISSSLGNKLPGGVDFES